MNIDISQYCFNDYRVVISAHGKVQGTRHMGADTDAAVDLFQELNDSVFGLPVTVCLYNGNMLVDVDVH